MINKDKLLKQLTCGFNNKILILNQDCILNNLHKHFTFLLRNTNNLISLENFNSPLEIDLSPFVFNFPLNLHSLLNQSMFNIIINNLPLSCFIKTGTVLLLPYKENKYLGLSVITNPEYFIHSNNQNIISFFQHSKDINSMQLIINKYTYAGN